MSFPIPNLQQLIDNAEADLAYKSVQLTLRPNIEGWLARMLAGAVRGLYLYILRVLENSPFYPLSKGSLRNS